MDVVDLMRIPKQRLKVKAGRILLSEPLSIDPYFRRSVIYVAEHNDKGSFGLIINKPIPLLLNEAVANAPKLDTKLGMGGPVENQTLHYLHRKGDLIPHSLEVADGVFWGGDFDTIKKLITSGDIGPNDIRLFVGYAGWTAGQLDEEMERNSWAVAPGSAELVFDTPRENLWQTIMERLGAPYSYMVRLPEDPRLN
ncbi:MAG: YqgE/AlgH family protein [Flavobacteriales bacterium]|nr:YqgE/AlgH family protein [Flavobacteriales bacterium]